VPLKGHIGALVPMERVNAYLSGWDEYPDPSNCQTKGLRFAGWRGFCAALNAAWNRRTLSPWFLAKTMTKGFYGMNVALSAAGRTGSPEGSPH